MADTPTPEATPGGSETPRGIRQQPVTEWLCANVDDVTPPLRFALITGGHSNLTYSVTDSAGRRLVLRRPPLGAVLKTAHDMGREHRIISALVPTQVPVPVTRALCTDESVNDAPFYIMELVDGVVLASADMVRQHVAEEKRQALGERVIDVLADLHSVDPDAVGLGKLGRKEAYIERQLKRWSTQWEKSKTRELSTMEEVHRALEEKVPEQIGSAIVHGDYRLGNMLVDPGSSAGGEPGVNAVLDWELCTLGDPLADVGYLMNDGLRRARTASPSTHRRPPAASRHANGCSSATRSVPAARSRESPTTSFQAWPPGSHRRRCAGPLPQGCDGRRSRHRCHAPRGRESGPPGPRAARGSLTRRSHERERARRPRRPAHRRSDSRHAQPAEPPHALTYELVTELHETLAAIDADHDCRVVILTGGRSRLLRRARPHRLRRRSGNGGAGSSAARSGDAAVHRLAGPAHARLRKPIIAAVNGRRRAGAGAGPGIGRPHLQPPGQVRHRLRAARPVGL